MRAGKRRTLPSQVPCFLPKGRPHGFNAQKSSWNSKYYRAPARDNSADPRRAIITGVPRELLSIDSVSLLIGGGRRRRLRRFESFSAHQEYPPCGARSQGFRPWAGLLLSHPYLAPLSSPFASFPPVFLAACTPQGFRDKYTPCFLNECWTDAEGIPDGGRA